MNRYHVKYSSTTQSLLSLKSFISEIIITGKISDDDILTLRYWMDDNKHLAGNYPFDKIYSLIDGILSDGVIEEEEKEKLLKILSDEKICDHSFSSIDSLCGRYVCLTGNFTFASRKEIEETIEKYSGFNEHKSLTSRTNYLFVGGKGSADWAFGNYGNKIKKAKELQEKGCPILILDEDILAHFFSTHNPPDIYTMQECLQLFDSLSNESLEIIQEQIHSAIAGCFKVVHPLSPHLEPLISKDILSECTDFNWSNQLYRFSRNELASRIESLNTGLHFRKNSKLESLINLCTLNIPERIRELFPEYGAFMLNERFLNSDLLFQLQKMLRSKIQS